MKTFNDFTAHPAIQSKIVKLANQTFCTNLLYNAPKGDRKAFVINGNSSSSSGKEYVEVSVEDILNIMATLVNQVANPT